MMECPFLREFYWNVGVKFPFVTRLADIMRIPINILPCIVKFLFTFWTSVVSGQSQEKYNGQLNGELLYESITLNVDSTFQWTSAYDLVFSEYGKYELQGNNLIPQGCSCFMRQ